MKPSPRSLVARYKAGKATPPLALARANFPKFMGEIKRLTDQERDARADLRQSRMEVLREITQFAQVLRDLPPEFDSVSAQVFRAGRNHGEEPRITDLLSQLGEAQREFEDAARFLYGAPE